MKKLFLILSFVGLSCIAAQAQKVPKVATVDMRAVVEKYEYAKAQTRAISADQKRMQQEFEILKQNLKSKEDETRKAQQDAQNPSLNEQGKATARRTFEVKLTELRQLDAEVQRKARDAEASLRQRQQQTLANIFDAVKPVVEKIAKDKSVDLVLNGGTFNPDVVLFADKSLDITDEVLKKLNDDFNSTAASTVLAKPEEKPAGTAAPASGSTAPAGGLAPLPSVGSPK
jgi:outer membrane protein